MVMTRSSSYMPCKTPAKAKEKLLDFPRLIGAETNRKPSREKQKDLDRHLDDDFEKYYRPALSSKRIPQESDSAGNAGGLK
jgi:hypothetical protein